MRGSNLTTRQLFIGSRSDDRLLAGRRHFEITGHHWSLPPKAARRASVVRVSCRKLGVGCSLSKSSFSSVRVWQDCGCSGRGTPVSAQPNPAVVGQWSAAQDWPAVSVHAALLPTGKVIFYPYTDEPRVWDPLTNAIASVAQASFNPFCSGLTLLADGRLFVGGGHISNDVGLKSAGLYDSRRKCVVAAPGHERGTLVPNGDDACRWKCAHRVGQRRSGCRPQHSSAGVGQWQLARFDLGTDPPAVLPDDDARAQRQGVLRRAGAVHQVSRHHRYRNVDGRPDERWRKPDLRKWSDVRARQDTDRRRGRSAARVGGSHRPQSAEPELAAGGIDVESPAVSRTPPCFPMARCSSQAAAAARVSTIPMLPSMPPSSGILRRALSRRFRARRTIAAITRLRCSCRTGAYCRQAATASPTPKCSRPPTCSKARGPASRRCRRVSRTAFRFRSRHRMPRPSPPSRSCVFQP